MYYLQLHNDCRVEPVQSYIKHTIKHIIVVSQSLLTDLNSFRMQA
jgi:hypothetical protein